MRVISWGYVEPTGIGVEHYWLSTLLSMICWTCGDTLDKKFSPVSRSTCFTGTRQSFSTLCPWRCPSWASSRRSRLSVWCNTLQPQPLSIPHHDNFPIFSRHCNLLNFPHLRLETGTARSEYCNFRRCWFTVWINFWLEVIRLTLLSL